MKSCSHCRIRAWFHLTVVIVAISLACAASVLAQTCEDRNPPHAVALLLRLQSYCENYDVPYSFDLYGLASVAGDEAIPALRKIAAWPTDTGTGYYCQRWVSAARVALAKLGDKKYREALDQSTQDSKHRYPPIGELAIVGDDGALRTLIEYLVAHANDPAMYHDFGDYGSDTRDWLLREIDTIRSRRRVPDLPTANYSPEGIAQWKNYLARHKDVQLTFPVYPNVSDPYLNCLARKVDWGYPDAILAIAAFGGDAALPILRQFPRPSPGDAMGFASAYGTLFDRPGLWANVQGNAQVALAQLGDRAMFDQIVSELGDKYAYEAVRKLEFIGGKQAVDALIHSLGMTDEVTKKLENLETPQRAYLPIWRASAIGVQGEIEQETCTPFSSHPYQACVMGVLALMVKDPPLPADTKMGKENIQLWKDWWVKNKDQAVFVQKPDHTFE
jgi:HEAT repeat protein